MRRVCHGFTLLVGLLKRQGWAGRKAGFLTLRITLSSQETDPKRRRNPLQKAAAHKDDENPLTLQEVVANPPRCPEPPFHTGEVLPVTPWFIGGFGI